MDLLAPGYINGLTLLGGEPFEPENQRCLLPFLHRVRATYPDKTIWGFSGFTYEELTTDGTHPRCEVTDEMLSLLDVLVDGRFVEELKDISLRFRGSFQPAPYRPERQPPGRTSVLSAGSDLTGFLSSRTAKTNSRRHQTVAVLVCPTGTFLKFRLLFSRKA